MNRCSWAHCLRETARLLQFPEADLLSLEERQALDGKRSPHGVIIPPVAELLVGGLHMTVKGPLELRGCPSERSDRG